MSTTETRPSDVLEDQVWSLADVARFLGSRTTSHASRWLAKHRVPQFDVGTGQRLIIRVRAADVRVARDGCLITPDSSLNPPRSDRKYGYVPRYRRSA